MGALFDLPLLVFPLIVNMCVYFWQQIPLKYFCEPLQCAAIPTLFEVFMQSVIASAVVIAHRKPSLDKPMLTKWIGNKSNFQYNAVWVGLVWFLQTRLRALDLALQCSVL